MFYVSSIKSDGRIGITDTRDSVEEFYSNSEIVRFHEENKLKIFGASYWNHKATCTPIKLGRTLSLSELKPLLDEWKKLHNPWTEHPVENYLASAKVGTVIDIVYDVTADESRQIFHEKARLIHLKQGVWLYEDSSSTVNGKTGDASFATWVLDATCNYSKCKKMVIS